MQVISLFKEIASFGIRYSAIPFLVTNLFARNKVAILVYHDPNPQVLESHLKYLSKKYNFIPLSKLVDAIHSKNWTDIPQKSLVITLDDGHKGNIDLMGVFRKNKINPTIYLCSQIVNTHRHFWFKLRDINPQYLKKYSHAERLELLEKDNDFTSLKEFPESERHAMNSKEVALAKDFVDFQSHSRFHPVLTTSTDEDCKNEIFKSKKELETLSGKSCKHFAYPNGDYAEREIELLKAAGYLSARTIDVGWNDASTDPYKLRAISITDDASINLLAAQLSGITIFLRHLLKGSFKGNHPTIKPEGVKGEASASVANLEKYSAL
jgi:peptidoglycan/xylan/chitin deacetylase (PgdA/CDA1 family)